MKKYAQNLTEKIISEHLVQGRMETGTEIFLRVDSTLVHDMSGTLAYIGLRLWASIKSRCRPRSRSRITTW